MGDRVSVQFKTGDDVSVALFHHWGGKEFAFDALEYAQELMKERKGDKYPLDRFEPNTVMVDFVRWFLSSGDIMIHERLCTGLYFGKDQNDGDNSDNGNYVIEFFQKTRKVKLTGGHENEEANME